jgi:hypothetical protein
MDAKVAVDAVLFKIGAIVAWVYSLTVVAGNFGTLSMMPDFPLRAYFWLGFFPTVIPIIGGLILYWLARTKSTGNALHVLLDSKIDIYEVAFGIVGVIMLALAIVGGVFLISLVMYDAASLRAEPWSAEDLGYLTSDVMKALLGIVLVAFRKELARLISDPR